MLVNHDGRPAWGTRRASPLQHGRVRERSRPRGQGGWWGGSPRSEDGPARCMICPAEATASAVSGFVHDDRRFRRLYPKVSIAQSRLRECTLDSQTAPLLSRDWNGTLKHKEGSGVTAAYGG
ncbi:hypothetical protein LZ32DRAFT_112660 [Colletotrichum eremochloae]|nr:hypothetical protein LZ32DRAFT_112660 [Colletotrichum eremochloae]